MGLRNLFILFFSVLAVSLVVLIIFFSLFFDKMDLSFNTHVPDTAPSLGHIQAKKRLQSQGGGTFAPEGNPATSSGRESNAEVGFVTPFDGLWPRTALVNVPAEVEGSVKTHALLDAHNLLPSLDAGTSRSLSLPDSETFVEEVDTPLKQDSKVEPSPILRPMEDEQAEPVRHVTPPLKGAMVLPARRPGAPVPIGPKLSPESSSSPAPQKEDSSSIKSYRVYVGGFSSPADAQNAVDRYRNKGLNPIVKSQAGGRSILQFGIYNNEAAARKLAEETGAAVESTR